MHLLFSHKFYQSMEQKKLLWHTQFTVFWFLSGQDISKIFTYKLPWLQPSCIKHFKQTSQAYFAIKSFKLKHVLGKYMVENILFPGHMK